MSLGDQGVLVAGGYKGGKVDGSRVYTAELYNPIQGTWISCHCSQSYSMWMMWYWPCSIYMTKSTNVARRMASGVCLREFNCPIMSMHMVVIGMIKRLSSLTPGPANLHSESKSLLEFYLFQPNKFKLISFPFRFAIFKCQDKRDKLC